MATRPPTGAKQHPLRTLTMRVLLLAAALPALSACVPLVLGTVAVITVDVKQDRRTVGKYLDDGTLEVQLRTAIRADENLAGANVSITAHNGMVLLTGQVAQDEQRQRVDALVQSYKQTGKVSVVVNELELGNPTNILSRTNDTWITAKARFKLLQVGKELPLPAIKVVTEHGKVYLLGLLTEAEAEAAVAAVRTIRGVTHIVKVFGRPVE